MLLSKFRYTDLDEEKYSMLCGKLKQNIWLEMNQNLTALEKVKVLNHIFYEVYKFRGQLPGKTGLNDYFLNTLMDTKKGSAISLGILYIAMARNMDIPLFGVDLQQHFVVAYMDDTIPAKQPGEYSEDEVLFYIAVANKGSVFTANEIDHYLAQIKAKPKPQYFLPAGNVTVIRRLINEMTEAYLKEGKHDLADQMNKLLEAFE